MKFPMLTTLAAMMAAGIFSIAEAQVQIDRYGQFTDVDFPQKVFDDKELVEDIERDKDYYASLPVPERTFWGGLPGSREKYGLTATGFFHLEAVPGLNGRIMLVDPEGYLYFHLGMCCTISSNEVTKVTGREEIFEWLPTKENGFEKARLGLCASFYVANWIRKFGSFDETEWQAVIIERCRHWGFNAHGEFTAIRGDNAATGFAMTKCLEHYMEGKEQFHLVCRKFIDPFDDFNIQPLHDNLARRMAPFIGKPELIGYYTENEVQYSNVVPSIIVNPEPIPAKRAFVEAMENRYGGDIAAFNKNWHASFGVFPDVNTAVLKAETQEAREDMLAFEEIFFDKLFGLLAATLKDIDPDHLYLGERMLVPYMTRETVLRPMGKHCDAISANYYTHRYDSNLVDSMARTAGKPVMLSEFSFGSTEQGLFGCRTLPSQDERGKEYSIYVENAAASPNVIGIQWFCLLDEANTGRGWTDFYGERFNLGFLNVCDRPYKEFAAHAAKSNALAYDLVEGKRQPVPAPPMKILYAGTREKNVPRIASPELDFNPDKYRMDFVEPLYQSLVTMDKISKWGKFHFAYDQDFLYVMVRMPDETPAVNQASEIDGGDCLEIFYGGDPRISGRMQPHDRQLLVRIDQNAVEYQWRHNGKPVETTAQPKINLRLLPDDVAGWEVEVALPWAEIALEPEPGKSFRFDIIVDKGGDTPGEREDRIVWNGLEENYFRRDIWGIGTFGE